ncbi:MULTISPECIES: competence type IV pilus minor pilin ComGD [unclassified Lactococcus]|uniref:competence type IV pilus minor pilin ComGD n=1 Tax=unclassified Lactococcus TaxID=2643510 RepID=UPI001E5C07DF|nr:MULTISPECIES: competence type IV pilus minor pilin ComGD [unclassified Lactococcus]
MRLAASLIKGFTLIEALLVLMITSFILLYFSSELTKTVKFVQNQLFILTFENAYKDTQADAGLLGIPTSFSSKNKILMSRSQKIDVPNEILIDDFNIIFNEKGENSSLSKIKIRIPSENKTITYQLEMGSGKYKKTIS